jgi:hypothetical protein
MFGDAAPDTSGLITEASGRGCAEENLSVIVVVARDISRKNATLEDGPKPMCETSRQKMVRFYQPKYLV